MDGSIIRHSADGAQCPGSGQQPADDITLASWLAVLPGLTAHRLDRLTPEHVERFYTRLEAEGLAPATVLQIHRILSRALKVAVQRGYVARNVATLVDAPAASQDEIEPLTLDEALRIMRLAATRRNGTRWSVALALGLRQGEALGLRWQHVHLDAGTLTIR
jgi:integrase